MPMQKGQSGFLAKNRGWLNKAWQRHKDDETDYGFQKMPAGIDGGIAQLARCFIDRIPEGKDNAGEYQFQAMAVVKYPKEFNGERLEGRQMWIRRPLYDTPNWKSGGSKEEHLAWVLNELRKLGMNTRDIGEDDLEENMAALAEAGPHFSFSTREGKKAESGPYKDKPPITQIRWHGLTNWTGEEEEPGYNGVEDRTTAQPTAVTSSKRTGTVSPPKTNGSSTVERGKPAAKTPPPSTEPEVDEYGDLDTLAERAEAGDDEAAQTLSEMARNLGIDQETIDAADGWEVVVSLITGGSPPDEGEEADEPVEEPVEEEEDTGPQVGQVLGFKPIDPATKQRAKKAIQVEILAVDNKSRTVTIKSLVDRNKSWKLVGWDKLEPV